MTDRQDFVERSLGQQRRSLQHPLQFLHALLNLRLQFTEVFQDFARRAVRHFFVNDFLVAVEREVVALRGDVGLGHAETLRGAWAVEFAAVAAALPQRGRCCITLTPALSRKLGEGGNATCASARGCRAGCSSRVLQRLSATLGTRRRAFPAARVSVRLSSSDMPSASTS